MFEGFSVMLNYELSVKYINIGNTKAITVTIITFESSDFFVKRT